MTETPILKAIMIALGNEPDLRVFRNNTGALKDEDGRIVEFGLAPGSADIVAILAPHGRAVFLEVKTFRRGSKQSVGQRAFQSAVQALGAPYFVVRSADQAIRAVNHVRAAQGADAAGDDARWLM